MIIWYMIQIVMRESCQNNRFKRFAIGISGVGSDGILIGPIWKDNKTCGSNNESR